MTALLVTSLAGLCGWCASTCMAASLARQPAVETPPTAQALDTRDFTIPGTAFTVTLVRCPGRDGANDEPAIGDLYVLPTEVAWDLYDVFVYRLDLPADQGDADATSRPSKPYVPPDRGFGHRGFPAMGMTRDAAIAFCDWINERTGVPARLPTPAEWTHLARADGDGDFGQGLDVSDAATFAWSQPWAGRQTRAAAKGTANAFGLYDMHGNVAEWVFTNEGRPIAMGGSYREPIGACTATSTMRQRFSWNESDPQIPKSNWWLADCSWVGFRFVVDADQWPKDEQNEEHTDE